MLSELEAWPQRVETVDTVELLTLHLLPRGSRVRLKQLKLSEVIGDITRLGRALLLRMDAEDRRRHQRGGPSGGSVGLGRARLTLTLDMRGFLSPVVALFYGGLTNRH